ncbi:MAG TPA: polysaccharide biosynthesis tyrosine autokinase [Pyrinomonadaceae bacterium]|nr:polysaccharide biosynthesis tyrosine autokinase [Pyrinomonadaceae bacterium]
MNDRQEIIRGEREALELEAASPAAPLQAHGPYGYGADQEEGEGAHLRDYWRAVVKRLWLVLGVVALVTMLAAVYMARQADVYVSQARVQVDLETAGPALGASKSQSVIINNAVNDPTYFNTQLQILTSPGLLRRVVKTLDLEHNQEFLRPHAVRERSSWKGLLRVLGLAEKEQGAADKGADELPLTASVAPAVSRDDLAEARRLAPFVRTLQAGLKVEPVKETRTAGYVKDTRLIDISFRHPDPQVAAKIVNAVAETFVYQNLEKKTETNSTTGDFLQKRVAELQNQIRSDEERLANYAKNHQILSLSGEQNIVVDRLGGLNRQLLEAENERKLAEAAYRAGAEPKAAAALAGVGSGEADAKLAELRRQVRTLRLKYTEEHPEVVALREQMAELEKQIRESRSQATEQVTTNLETRYKQALAREQSLRAALERQRGETLAQNDAAIAYRIIQQEIETNKSLLDGLLQRSRENDVVLAGTPNNISVVDYALAPESPVGPRRAQSVLLAFMLSLSFGVGLALFLEYLNDTVRSSEDVERHLRLPALSVIPAAVGGARRLLPSALALRHRAGDGGDGEGPELLVGSDVRSPLAEAYRHLRTSLLLSRAGQAPRTLLVSSSLPGEGKTTTSVNTAVSLAQTGARVVVVDADMRRPRLHKIFHAPNRAGLSTILSSTMTDEELLGLLHRDEASGLDVLTAGPVSPNPAELLGSDQMRRLVAALEARYQHVVIDSPPIVPFTDSVLISKVVDGVILVVHGGRSSRGVVRRSKQILQEVGARVLGVVLNNVALGTGDYYYYQHYSSYYAEAGGGETVVSSQ